MVFHKRCCVASDNNLMITWFRRGEKQVCWGLTDLMWQIWDSQIMGGGDTMMWEKRYQNTLRDRRDRCAVYPLEAMKSHSYDRDDFLEVYFLQFSHFSPRLIYLIYLCDLGFGVKLFVSIWHHT